VFVGVLSVSAYVPDGGEIVGEAMILASNRVVVATGSATYLYMY
jgi:hypothetical protein